MAVQVDGGYKTFKVTTAVTIYRLVVLRTDGTIEPVDNVADIPIGVAQATAAANEHCTVKLLTAQGTFKIEAAGATVACAECYMTSLGKIDDTDPGSAVKWVRSLEAATAAADIIECVPMKL